MKNPFLRLAALLLVIVFTVSSCNFPTKSTSVTGGVEKSTTFELTSSGSSVELEGVSINLSSSNIGENTTVTFEKIASEPLEDDQVLAQSETYELVNMPTDFNGKLDVVFEIPRSVLSAVDKGDEDGASKISLWVGLDGYSRTGEGEVNIFLPVLDAKVDLKSKTVSATIDLNNLQADAGAKKASLVPVGKRFDTYWDITPNKVRFKVTTSLFGWQSTTYKTTNALYTIYFSRGQDFGPLMDSLMKALDETDKALSELGFTPKSIDIYIEDPGQNRLGVYTYSSYSGHYITIKPELLTSGTANEPLLTLGHEMMHYMQNLSYPKGSDWNSFASLDEAVAIWFESYLIYDNNYRALLADQHLLTALNTPTFSGSAIEMQRAGYGSSWYVHYIVNKYGFGFIRDAYTGGHMTGKASWSIGILDANGIGTEQLYPQYLTDLYLHPDQISSGITAAGGRYDDLFKNWMKLGKTSTGEVTFTPTSDGIPTDESTSFSAQAGNINGDLPPNPYTIDPVPTFTLSRTLYPWNGYAFSVKMDPNLYPYDLGQLDVKLSAYEPYSGLMIFGIPQGKTINDAVYLFGPETPVTSENYEPVVVNSVSTKDNDGKYKEVFFILYNAGDNESSMTVEVQFKPIQPALLRGDMQITNRMYQTDPCAVIQGCSPYVNPPACVNDFVGGMGDCGDVECDVPIPCAGPAPDFCYWCSDKVGASTVVGNYLDNKPSLSFMINEKGEIQSFESPFNYQLVDPKISYSGDGSFSMTWVENDNYQKPYVTISLSGKVDSSGGSGIWSYEYEGVGTLFSGTWSMAPSTY